MIAVSEPGPNVGVAAGRAHGGFGYGDDQHRGVLGPALVELAEQAEEGWPRWGVAPGVEVAPGLRIIAARRPSGRFEDAQQVGFGNCLTGKGARRPALQEDLLDVVVGGAGLEVGQGALHFWYRDGCLSQHETKRAKVFCFFFSKKKTFLS